MYNKSIYWIVLAFILSRRTALQVVQYEHANTPSFSNTPARKTLRITIDELDESSDEDAEETGDDGEGSSETETVLDLTLAEIDDEARERLDIDEDINGVLITAVDYGSGREGLRRLRRGDVIVEVTQRDVSSIEDVKERVEAQKSAGRSVVLLSIFRRGEYAHVPVKLDEEDDD